MNQKVTFKKMKLTEIKLNFPKGQPSSDILPREWSEFRKKCDAT